MEKIIEGIKHPFTDKNWQKKLGYLIIIYIAITFIGGLFTFLFQVPIEIALEFVKGNNLATSMLSLFSSFASIGTFVITFPLTIFLYGYLFDYLNNVYKENTDVLPELHPIKERFFRGLKLMILMFLVKLPGAILSFISFFGTILLLRLAYDGILSTGIAILLAFLGLLILTLISFANFILSLSAGYLYLTTGRISKSLDVKTIISTIQNNEKTLLKIFGYFIIIGCLQMGVGIFSLALLCITFVTAPIITLAGMFVKTYILGIEFKNIIKSEK